MKRFITIIFIILLTFSCAGCAWENLPEGAEEGDQLWEIRMVMESSINENYYYIIAINFSGDPDNIPYPEVEGPDRGRNWDVYYMFGKPGDRPELITEPAGFYKGEGGVDTGGALPISTDMQKRRDDPVKPASENDPLDDLPEDFDSTELEFLDAQIISSPLYTGGAAIANNTIYLKFNWTRNQKYRNIPAIVNINMMVSDLGVDSFSNDPDIEATVWDSFSASGAQGVSLDVDKFDEFEEEDFYVEEQDEYINIDGQFYLPQPSANIVNWMVKIL